MAKAKKKDQEKQEEERGTANQVSSPNPGEAELEEGTTVEPTTVADVVTPDGVLENAQPKNDETIGSF